MTVARGAGPTVAAGHATFSLADPDRRFRAVRLFQEVADPRSGPYLEYSRRRRAWAVRFPRPPVDRMEYLFEVTHRDGTTERIPDPVNPLRAPDPSGDRSVVEFPGYRPPEWLAGRTPRPGRPAGLWIPSSEVHGRVRALVWTSPGAGPAAARLPLLVVHDGPAYARYAALLRLLAAATAAGRLPPLRAVLLQPPRRDEVYSASPAYARALAADVLPAVARLAPTPRTRTARVGLGASLGALALLHAHRTRPSLFGALYLQSGSFFRRGADPEAAGFPPLARIERFVGRVLARDRFRRPIRVTMTCGTVEQNLPNNRELRDALARQGYDVSLHENRDGHTWVGWRDTFDPHLVELLVRMWT